MQSGGEVRRLTCPHLGCIVELTEERERHIAARHPELLPETQARIAATLAAPDVVRRSARRPSARMFSRRFDDRGTTKHVIVVVVSEMAGDRHWIVTAYVTRRLTGGIVEWRRS